jgi:small subunit ribosomal protein S9
LSSNQYVGEAVVVVDEKKGRLGLGGVIAFRRICGRLVSPCGPCTVISFAGPLSIVNRDRTFTALSLRSETIITCAMASRELSRSLQRAFDALAIRPRPQCARTIRHAQRSLHPRVSRCISTTASRNAEIVEEQAQEKFQAAAPIDFDAEDGTQGKKRGGKTDLRTLRVVPASPSYFSAKPTFTDDFLSLSALLRKVATLPVIPPAEAPKVAWKTIDQYRIMTNEPVKTQRYHKMLHILRRLNCIHPSLMPDEVVQAMLRYKKANQPGDIKPNPGVIDELGRAKGVGRRKTSSAVAWLVEGEGEVLVNGKSLSQFFGRLHHRESAVWALKATHRLDKYNVFALVQGGGLTGQAEAMTLAVAKALLVHEPALKPAVRRGKLQHPFSISGSCVGRFFAACPRCGLGMMIFASGTSPRERFTRVSNLSEGSLNTPYMHEPNTDYSTAGCITRDPRKVERKKAGHVKARKMPTWVKR